MSKHINTEITHIEQAIQILSYNEQWWDGFKPHNKDLETLRSLAESPYAYTEKQGKLAVLLLKRYHTLFQKFKIDITQLLDTPVFKEPFRIISFEKSIKKITHESKEYIELKFPYTSKLIQLVRCLKHQKTQGLLNISYDGDSKKWIMPYSEVVVYYCVLIAARYDFKFYDLDLLEVFQDIKREKLQYKKPLITVTSQTIEHKHVTKSFRDWWQHQMSHKKFIIQCDSLKNLGIETIFKISPRTLTEKIAFANKKDCYIDRNTYSKTNLLKALQDLDSLPALVPVGHDFSDIKDVDEIFSWYDAFKQVGIKIDQVAWGFTMSPPPDFRKSKDGSFLHLYESYPKKLPDYQKEIMFKRWNDLYVTSKADKEINDNTKIIFAKLKIPRTLIKSRIKIKSAFNMLSSEHFPNVSDTMSKMVENLPKRIYYVNKDTHNYLNNEKHEFL